MKPYRSKSKEEIQREVERVTSPEAVEEARQRLKTEEHRRKHPDEFPPRKQARALQD